jgi:hypothetical protein
VPKQRKLIEDLEDLKNVWSADAGRRDTLRDMLELIRGAQAYKLQGDDKRAKPRRETSQTPR